MTDIIPGPNVSQNPGPRHKRSVLFLHYNYYHYYYLARALRARGWDAVSLGMESPTSPNSSYYHDVDCNVWSDDFGERCSLMERVFKEAVERFSWVQFSGDGMMAFRPDLQDVDIRRAVVPKEFIELRRRGIKIGYTLAGCTDGNAQSSWNRWTGNNCLKCSLYAKSDVCSDFRNHAWAHKREMFCDLIATEMMPKLDYNSGSKVYSEPLTMAVDETIWHPSIDIPESLRIPREVGEVLVLHAVGNYESEAYFGRRDYKGTAVLKQTVEMLRAEGLPIRLHFLTNIPGRQMRYYQAQADIVVDQLNFGRYGAFARESLMMGKPVVGFLKRDEDDGEMLASVRECPIVSASEETIGQVLRDLVNDSQRRRELCDASRRFALKWHSASALAERFEQVYDHVMAGGNPATYRWGSSAEIAEVVQ